MITQHIPGLQIVPPSQESGLYETGPLLPKMHCVCLVVGKRNSGKTVATINLIEKMGYDYVIAVSPTMNSNREIMERLNIDYVFEDVDDLSVIDSIKEIVQLLQDQHTHIIHLTSLLKGKDLEIELLIEAKRS